MALAPTLYQFDLELNHTDRGLSLHVVTRTARHPSETMSRVWLRVLAWAWHYEERLQFGVGLSNPDEVDLFADDLRAERTLVVRVGKPDPQKVQRDVDQNARARVAVMFEDPSRMESFVASAQREALRRLSKVELCAVDPAMVATLAKNEDRRVKASVTIAGDHFYIECHNQHVDGAVIRASIGEP